MSDGEIPVEMFLVRAARSPLSLDAYEHLSEGLEREELAVLLVILHNFQGVMSYQDPHRGWWQYLHVDIEKVFGDVTHMGTIDGKDQVLEIIDNLCERGWLRRSTGIRGFYSAVPREMSLVQVDGLYGTNKIPAGIYNPNRVFGINPYQTLEDYLSGAYCGCPDDISILMEMEFLLSQVEILRGQLADLESRRNAMPKPDSYLKSRITTIESDIKMECDRLKTIATQLHNQSKRSIAV